MLWPSVIRDSFALHIPVRYYGDLVSLSSLLYHHLIAYLDYDTNRNGWYVVGYMVPHTHSHIQIFYLLLSNRAKYSEL